MSTISNNTQNIGPMPMVQVLKRGQFTEVPENEVDYEFEAPSALFNRTINLIPMQNAVTAQRAFYADKFFNQALPLNNGEIPYIQTLKDPATGESFERFVGRKTGVVTLDPEDGESTILAVSPDYIKYRNSKGQIRQKSLYNNFKFNRKSGITNIPLVKKGDVVSGDRLLAKTNYTADDGTLSLGLNARIALVPFKGWSADDAVVISEDFAKRLASQHMYTYRENDDKSRITGKAHFTSLFPDQFTKEQLENIDENGVIKVGSRVKEGDPLILSTRPRMLSSQDQVLGRLSKHLKNTRNDASEVWDHHDEGVVTDVIKTKNGYKVNVSSINPARVGDKLTERSGNKSTIAKIIPQHLMPRTKDGQPVDMLFNQLGLPCYDSKTEILTKEDGWIPVKKTDLSHTYMTLNPDTLHMEWQKATDVHHYYHSGEMYGMENEDLSICVTPTHRHFTMPLSGPADIPTDLNDMSLGGKFELKQAARIAGEPRKYLKAAKWAGESLDFPQVIKIAPGQEGEQGLMLPLTTWLEILGYVVGDGICRGRRGKEVLEFGFFGPRNEDNLAYLDHLRNLFEGELGLTCRRYGEVYHQLLGVFHAGLINKVRQYARSVCKHMPRKLLDLPPAYAGIFLSAAISAIRHIPNFNRKEGYKCECSFTYTGHGDLDGIQEMFAKNGAALSFARINRHAVSCRVKPDAGACVNTGETPDDFIIDRYKGKVHCVTVPNGVVLVRRNGKAYFSGNSRVNANLIYEVLLGKVAEKTGKRYTLPSFNKASERWYDFVENELKQAGLSDTEELYDPELDRTLDQPVTVGNGYVMKLHHTADSKLSARGQGRYDANFQPSKGGEEGQHSKRISGLESVGLLSAGAYGVIKDAIHLRGEKNDDYWRQVRMGETPTLAKKSPFVWDKYLALMQGAGINAIDKGNGILQASPFTDRQFENMSPVELENPEIIDLKNLKPVKGGLFDPANSLSNKWAKITLDRPYPNPGFEDAIASLLGIRKSDMYEIIKGDKSLEGYGKGSIALQKALAAIDMDEMMAKAKNDFKHGPKSQKQKALNRMQYIKGLQKNGLTPDELMITKVPVIPASFRPYSMMGDTFIPGDVNELYKDVFLMRDAQRQLADTIGEDEAMANSLNMYNSIKALYGLGDTMNKKLQQRGVSGFMEKLVGGTSKFSFLNRSVNSKPVDFTGRAVIDVNPELGMDQIMLPRNMALTMFAPYVQRKLVQNGMKPSEAIVAVTNKDDSAIKALDAVVKERPVMYSRAPAWHKYNTLGGWVVPHDGDNILINPLNATGMGADYNGDANIGYVICLLSKEAIKKGLVGDFTCLTKGLNKYVIQSMFKNIEIPTYDETKHEIAIVNLADFPHGEFVNSNPNGKNGPLHFYQALPGTKVIAFDETTFKPKWADIAYWSHHPEREIVLVNLSNNYQIITDDDPRAVYGFDPDSEEFTLTRFTPDEAKTKGVIVPRVAVLHELDQDHSVDEVEFGGKMLKATPEFGYMLGALMGDGWVTQGMPNCVYFADLVGANAMKLKSYWESVFPEVTYRFHKQFKAGDASRYGDTVQHVYTFPESGREIFKSFKKYLKGDRDEKTSGSANKAVPSFIASTPKECILGFLAGVFDTDGTISNCKPKSKNKSQLIAAVTSTSLQLVRDVKFLLGLIGIRSRISFSKMTARQNSAWQLACSTIDFYDKGHEIVKYMVTPSKIMAFNAKEKYSEDPAVLNGKTYLPITKHLAAKLLDIIPAPKLGPKVKASVSAEAFALKSKFVNVRNACKVLFKKNLISKYLVDTINDLRKAYPDMFKAGFAEVFASKAWNDLERLAGNKDVMWLTIDSIDHTGKKEDVYDLTVPGYETFMSEEGVILSNTVNVHVPGTEEAVKDIKEKLMPSKQIFSIRDNQNIVNKIKQDQLLGLAAAAKRPSTARYTFRTKAQALAAIKAGRVKLNDDVVWLSE